MLCKTVGNIGASCMAFAIEGKAGTAKGGELMKDLLDLNCPVICHWLSLMESSAQS